jgi:hypothetical protein
VDAPIANPGYGSGLQIAAAGGTARFVEEDSVLVATGDAAIDDETSRGLFAPL